MIICAGHFIQGQKKTYQMSLNFRHNGPLPRAKWVLDLLFWLTWRILSATLGCPKRFGAILRPIADVISATVTLARNTNGGR